MKNQLFFSCNKSFCYCIEYMHIIDKQSLKLLKHCYNNNYNIQSFNDWLNYYNKYIIINKNNNISIKSNK